MYKERQKAANVKTIKKVVEAKARKKRKAMKKMENARKAAEGVLSQDDVSTKEKMAQVKRIYRKAGAGKKEKENGDLIAFCFFLGMKRFLHKD